MDFSSDKITKSAPQVVTLSDSDDEVFVGPVTEKEKQRAAKLSRRTQVFFPPVSWKLRSSISSTYEPTVHKDQSPLKNKDFHSTPIVFYEKRQSIPSSHEEFGHNPNTEGASCVSESRKSPTNGYAADISSAEKTSHIVPENTSLQYGYSADSLNSLSRDSLDIDHDSLEENKKSVYDTSIVEDLYDAGDYVKTRQDVLDGTVSCAPKQLTVEDVAELQRQLDRFALEMGSDGAEHSEKHNNSFESEDAVTGNTSPQHTLNLESVFVEKKTIPSPYDLNKQRLSDLLSFDSSFDRRSHPLDRTADMLGTVCEVSEPSSTDGDSRLSSVRLSEVYLDSPVDSPRKGSTDNLPNSTQLFEELERQIEEEESMHSNLQTSCTVSDESRELSNNRVETTYTVASNVIETVQDDKAMDDSLNSCFEDSASSHDNPCPEGIFNDTIEEMDMLLKYGMDYIYGRHCKTPIKKGVSHEELPRPKSVDCESNHSADSGRSTPRAGAKLAKAPTPVKRAPLTPRRAQCTPVKTPTSSKLPGCTVSGSASNSAPGPPRAVNARSALGSSVPVRSDKNSTPAPKNETTKFKVPAKIPVSASRVPRPQTVTPRSSKFLSEIRSPIGAYIHNTPSPVLMKNVKPKPCPSSIPRDFERRHRPVWDNVDTRLKKCNGSENVNPNVGHVLPAVHYVQAPCIKLDDHSLPKSRLPRLGDRFEKLLDSPCPQVIKHAGRVHVNPSSPQCAAAVEAVRLNFNDSGRSEPATDALFLLRFLRVKKFSVAMAQQMLLKFINLRQMYSRLCYNADILIPSVNELITNGYIFASPFRDAHGRRVIIQVASKLDPHKYTNVDMSKAHVIAYETLLDSEDSHVFGFTHFADIKDFSAAIVTMWSPQEFSQCVRWGEQCLPMRHKEIHIVNLPTPLKFLYDFCSSRLSPKIRGRINVHNTVEDVHKKIDKKCLPKEYGGEMPMAEMIELFKKEILCKRERILALDHMQLLSDSGIITSARPPSLAPNKMGITNLAGSFRRLEVD